MIARGIPIMGVIALPLMVRCPSAPVSVPVMDFEAWITNREPFTTIVPTAGRVGDFNRWITNRETFSNAWRRP